MKTRNVFAVGLAIFALVITASWAQIPNSNYMQAGGTRWVIGGSLDVVSGGDLDVESGGALKIAGTAITASGAEINKLAGVTAGSVTANKALVCGASSQLNSLAITSLKAGVANGDGADIKTCVMGSGVLSSGQATSTVVIAGCTASSLVFVTINTANTTAVLKSAVPGTGSFVVTLSEAANTDTTMSWQVWK